jgi:hypothetical protein
MAQVAISSVYDSPDASRVLGYVTAVAGSPPSHASKASAPTHYRYAVNTGFRTRQAIVTGLEYTT